MIGARTPGTSAQQFYPTPAWVTLALLNGYDFGTKYRQAAAWECACGKGDMSEVLKSSGKFRSVCSSDINDFGYEGALQLDFLQASHPAREIGYAVITNPPFKLAESFVEHWLYDLQESRHLALFLKLVFLEGQQRSILLEHSPLKKVLVFRKRVAMKRDGAGDDYQGMVAHAWFVWDRVHTDVPTIGWI